MWDSLPTETWTTILSTGLARWDLQQCSEVCKFFRNIAIPLLRGEVDFDFYLSPSHDILNRLTNDPSLAKFIRYIHLKHMEYFLGLWPRILDVFSAATGLVSLQMDQTPFFNFPIVQSRFVAILNEKRSSFGSFSFQNCSLATPDFAISGIRTLNWEYTGSHSGENEGEF